MCTDVWRVQIAHLATRYAVPAIASPRAYPEAGGLMSYGTSLADAHRQADARTVGYGAARLTHPTNFIVIACISRA